MAEGARYYQVGEPTLLDVVDEAWSKERLPDDGERRAAALVKLMYWCLPLSSFVELELQGCVCLGRFRDFIECS